MKQQLKDILKHIGEDPNREGLIDTPDRIIRSWDKLYGGYKQDPKQILGAVFSETTDQMVLLRDIEFYSTCEHHMIPFFGKVHIAYLPDKKVVGISKLARLTECFARRLQIQERLTEQIADSLQDIIQPQGVAVMIEAQHLCMVARGVEKQNSIMSTSAIRGVFRKPEVRQEFFNLIGSKK